jgi:hypothetical protein
VTDIEKATFDWIVKEIATGKPKRYLIETGTAAAASAAGAVVLGFTKAGRRFLIVPGLEQQRHFPMEYCSQEAAEWCLKKFPGEYTIVNDWEIVEFERILELQ